VAWFFLVSEPRVLLEAVVENADAAVAAEQAGASRLELCANLQADGTTPDARVLQAIVERVGIPVWVMIRPRAGDFVYSDDELRACEQSILELATGGASGFVFGALRPDRTVQAGATSRIVECAHGLPVTFHRAFDHAPDLAVALEDVVMAGVTRVLTSGGAPTAIDGVATLASLVRQSRGRAVIMAGGGVRAHNVTEIVKQARVSEVHARFESGAQIRALVDLL
jgi:copper homeostasis protein